MLQLNKFEIFLLKRLAIEYPFIANHVPFLKVESRDKTGVGMYINLIYDSTYSDDISAEGENFSVSTNETIEISGLKYGLSYEVDITKGKIKFIELVTYGEQWDGDIPESFSFVKNT